MDSGSAAPVAQAEPGAALRGGQALLESLSGWIEASSDDRVAAARALEPLVPLRFVRMVRGDGPTPVPEVAAFVHEATGLEFVLIPGGTYSVGSPTTENGRASNELPQQLVLISPFLIGRTEVPQRVWSSHLDGGRAFDVSDNHPAGSVTWDEAVAFCDGFGFKLPSEVEWEVAARGGTTTPYFTGTELESVGGFANIADATFGPHAREVGVWWHESYCARVADGHVFAAPVASFRCNQFGVFDMIGNADEWCRDVWIMSPEWSGRDPVYEGDDVLKVRRGGGWGTELEYLRAAARSYAGSGNPGSFRPVVEFAR